MTLWTLILAAVLLSIGVVAMVMLILGIEDRAIQRTGDAFDLTPDDAPRDDNDWPESRVAPRRINGDH